MAQLDLVKQAIKKIRILHDDKNYQINVFVDRSGLDTIDLNSVLSKQLDIDTYKLELMYVTTTETCYHVIYRTKERPKYIEIERF